MYISFSGGKDSTVLKHIVDQMYDNIPAVFIDTGLEYPEIKEFVKTQSNVEIIRPKYTFKEVIEKYGYPLVSKEQASYIFEARNTKSEKLRHKRIYGDERGRFKISQKWLPLVDADFDISHRCCDVMKKRPVKAYEKQTGRKPIVGTMAEESSLRKSVWIKNGCNAFESKARQISQPMSFWTEQDVLEYLVKYSVSYCPIYGEIIFENGSWRTTGKDRTGCIFCGFGAQVEQHPNRFQRLKETHPKLYSYCIYGGEYIDDKWKPNKKGLGLGKVLDFINVVY